MASKVVLTDEFKRDAKRLAKKHRSLSSDLKSLVSILESDPYYGDRLSPQTYKIRLAIKSKGKGKSGGARLISYVNIAIEDNPDNDDINVYLLTIYDKSEIESIPTKMIDGVIKDFLSEEE